MHKCTWHFYDMNHAQIASHINYTITYFNHATMFAISEATCPDMQIVKVHIIYNMQGAMCMTSKQVGGHAVEWPAIVAHTSVWIMQMCIWSRVRFIFLWPSVVCTQNMKLKFRTVRCQSKCHNHYTEISNSFRKLLMATWHDSHACWRVGINVHRCRSFRHFPVRNNLYLLRWAPAQRSSPHREWNALKLSTYSSRLLRQSANVWLEQMPLMIIASDAIPLLSLNYGCYLTLRQPPCVWPVHMPLEVIP